MFYEVTINYHKYRLIDKADAQSFADYWGGTVEEVIGDINTVKI